MNLFTVVADLLDNNLKLDVICHQINCCTTSAGGIAYSINKKYPYADRYKNRVNQTPRIKNGYLSVYDTPGKVYIQTPNDTNNPIVVCLAGQVAPGGSGTNVKIHSYSMLSIKETSDFREELFQQCLDEFAVWLSDKNSLRVGFPYYIGCGLAGGNWNNYYDMIGEFCKKLPQHTFYLCKIE